MITNRHLPFKMNWNCEGNSLSGTSSEHGFSIRAGVLYPLAC